MASHSTGSDELSSGVVPLGLQVGSVIDFDEHRGIGSVEVDGHRFMFHCTAIAGGSRRIDVDTTVAFVVRAGGPGQWEAFSVTPVSAHAD